MQIKVAVHTKKVDGGGYMIEHVVVDLMDAKQQIQIVVYVDIGRRPTPARARVYGLCITVAT